MTLSLSTSRRAGFSILSVSGAIDVHTAPELREGMDPLLDVTEPRIVVDLGGVDFLDSSALGVLVGASKEIAARNGALRVVCADPKLLRIFEITRLDEVITIVATVEDAVAPST